MGIKLEVGDKIVATNTPYSINVPNGTVMTVTSVLPSGAVMANNDRNGLNWTMLAGTFEPFTQPPATPTIWAFTPDADKGALLLAWQQGKVIEYYRDDGVWLATDNQPEYWDKDAYRVKPEPKRVTVTGWHNGGEWIFSTEKMLNDTVRITFDTIDGQPDYDSIKMEEM